MASPKSRKRSRKARSGPRPVVAPPPVATAPRGKAAVRESERIQPKVAAKSGAAPTRRQIREERERRAIRDSASAGRSLGTYGERPKSIFSPVPVSEIAILVGLIAVVIGLIKHGGPTLTVGVFVCALGVVEFSARDHFSGYRSHTSLLAAFPAVLIEYVLVKAVGLPSNRILILVPIVPVFALSFWLLQRSFKVARHNRAIRPPSV